MGTQPETADAPERVTADLALIIVGDDGPELSLVCGGRQERIRLTRQHVYSLISSGAAYLARHSSPMRETRI